MLLRHWRKSRPCSGRGSSPVGVVQRGLAVDGSEASKFQTTKMVLKDFAGHVIGTFGISRDVTALEQARAELAHRGIARLAHPPGWSTGWC